MHKTKFDRKKCLNCIYRGGSQGNCTTLRNIHCNYSGIMTATCLKRIPNKDGEIKDIRGDDYNNCKLYQKGRPIKALEEREDFRYGAEQRKAVREHNKDGV